MGSSILQEELLIFCCQSISLSTLRFPMEVQTFYHGLPKSNESPKQYDTNDVYHRCLKLDNQQ